MNRTLKTIFNLIALALLIAVGMFAILRSGSEAKTELDSSAAVVSEQSNESKTDLKSETTVKEAPRNTDAFKFASNLKVGINVGNSLDCYSNHQLEGIEDYETYWMNPRVTSELVDFIKATGFNTIKFPVTWDQHLLSDGLTIDPEWMARVKEVVDYAYSEGMYVIIDAHHDKWTTTTEEDVLNARRMTAAIWKQVAKQFRDYDKHLIFDGFNELRNLGGEDEFKMGSDEELKIVNTLNKLFVDTVRDTGGNNKSRYLMISPYVNSAEEKALSCLEIPNDPHLLVSIHFYTPYKFTGNDNPSEMDVVTWTENCEMTRTIDYMIQNLEGFIESKNIPVVITEMGASYKGDEKSRADWTAYVVDKFKKIGVSYIWWDDNYEPEMRSYGIIDRMNCNEAYPDIIDILLDR